MVLVAHPHQLPYLSLSLGVCRRCEELARMAAAAGFRKVALLEARLFGAVPWHSFGRGPRTPVACGARRGCSPLGYAMGTNASEAVAREAGEATCATGAQVRRLEAFVAQRGTWFW